MHCDPFLLQQDGYFPDADGRKIAFITGVVQNLMNKRTQLVWFAKHPQPDVRVEKVAHHFSSSGSRPASQSEISLIGPTISPWMVKEPTPVPNFRASLAGGGGVIYSTRLPKRVTRKG